MTRIWDTQKPCYLRVVRRCDDSADFNVNIDAPGAECALIVFHKRDDIPWEPRRFWVTVTFEDGKKKNGILYSHGMHDYVVSFNGDRARRGREVRAL
jgi:hypothetical protein